MFKLFQTIFQKGQDKAAAYPEDLIERATERAVDGTDRRLRAVSGYRKSLRPAILHAIDHVIALVDAFPAPLALNRPSYGTSPELKAFFASVEHMHEVLARDADLLRWRKTAEGGEAERVVQLLIMDMSERNVLGMALDGDSVRREVAQVQVSFANHRLRDPSPIEDDTRRFLKRRAFDHLLTLALGNIAASRGEQGELKRERDLLRAKLGALKSGNWGFEEGAEAQPETDHRSLQERIEAIDTQLATLSAGLLTTHLDILIDVLGHAEEHLRGERGSLCVDRMGIKQALPGPQAPEIPLFRLYNSVGNSVVARLVVVERADLPEMPNLLREGLRYFG